MLWNDFLFKKKEKHFTKEKKMHSKFISNYAKNALFKIPMKYLFS